MKKILLLFVLIGQVVFAQKIDVQSIAMVNDTETGGCYYPAFSPAGDYLLVTTENYAGLKQYTFADKSIKTLTKDAGAGYGVQISADGNTILYKKTEFVKNLRHSSLISYSRTSGTKQQLVAPTREVLTTRFAKNKPQFVKGKTLVATNITRTESTPVICIEDQKMVLYTSNARKVLIPNGQQASYIWPSISPDGKKIAYTVASKGTFVCGIDGSNPVSLGKLNAPRWINNHGW
jgi:Tol biopolymer transport system component